MCERFSARVMVCVFVRVYVSASQCAIEGTLSQHTCMHTWATIAHTYIHMHLWWAPVIRIVYKMHIPQVVCKF